MRLRPGVRARMSSFCHPGKKGVVELIPTWCLLSTTKNSANRRRLSSRYFRVHLSNIDYFPNDMNSKRSLCDVLELLIVIHQRSLMLNRQPQASEGASPQ